MYKNLYIIFFLCIFNSFQGKISNKHKNKIMIVYAINNKYIDYIYTSLYSLLENSGNNTIYEIIIQIGSGFEEKNKDLILTLEKHYFNCFITFIDMKDDFKTAIRGVLDSSTYYRLKLPILCPDINRIIHIDSDSIILKDLTELYTLNFEDKFILGRLDQIVSELDNIGIFTKIYINCGIILMDLYNLRKYDYTNKFLDYIGKHNNVRYLNHHDQTCINYVCYDRIGKFRPKYHMWPFIDEAEVKSFNNKLRYPYDEKEILQDYNNPYIIHYPGHFKLKNEYENTKYMILIREYKEKANKLKESLSSK